MKKKQKTSINLLVLGSTIFFFCFIIWVIVCADMGLPNIFVSTVHQIPYGDKLGHIGIFGLFTALTIQSLSYYYNQYKAVLLGAIIVLFFAIGEELSQLVFEYRTFDFGDMGADLIGIGLVFGGFCYKKAKK